MFDGFFSHYSGRQCITNDTSGGARHMEDLAAELRWSSTFWQFIMRRCCEAGLCVDR